MRGTRARLSLWEDEAVFNADDLILNGARIPSIAEDVATELRTLR